jgi:hypothetical protein
VSYSQELEKAQKIWYKKLKDSGFEDVEKDEENLIKYSSRFFNCRVGGSPFNKESSQSFYEAKEEYYRIAGHFLHDNKFKDEFEKKVWDLHSQGISFRDIAIKVRTKQNKANKDNIQTLVKELSKEMFKRNKNGQE